MNYYEEIEEVIDYIERNLNERITMDDIIKNAYCSLPQFYRIFYHVVGDTVMSYVRKRKLSCAYLELINTHKSIIDIAFDYGYESQQSFNRAFTNTFGISPGRCKQIGKNVLFYPRINIHERWIYMSGIGFEDVKIITLEPMKIAAHLAYEANIQDRDYEKIITKAWKGLIDWQLTQWQEIYLKKFNKKLSKMATAKWAVDGNLHIPPNTRYFGFENPFPTEKQEEYGYEAWALISDDINASNKITAKYFNGGLYATVSATYGKKSNLKEGWQVLHRWLEQSNYTYGNHQWLEEHITIPGAGGFHGFNLLMAIEEK